MLKTKQLMLACLVLALGLAVGFVLAQIIKTEQYPVAVPWEPGDRTTLSADMVNQLEGALRARIEAKTSEPVIALEPQLLLTHFSNVEVTDFDGVEAVVGQYLVANNQIQYSNTEVVDATADDISASGLKTFFTNYYKRNQLSIQTPFDDVMATLDTVATSTDDIDDTEEDNKDDFIACTMDAMECPDGSYVGRTGPNCTFVCPAEAPTQPKEIVCTQEQKEADVCIEIYAPVCANVKVECVTAPCNPVPQTFSNSCYACSEDRVISYVDGSCEGGDLVSE